MGRSQWIQQVKTRAKMPEVIQRLGLQPGRRGSFGPCPGCGADRRGSGDNRGPLIYGKSGGWKCYRPNCDAKGDAVTLVSWVHHGTPDPNRDQYAEIQAFCAGEGWCDPPGQQAKPARSSIRRFKDAFSRTGKGRTGRSLRPSRRRKRSQGAAQPAGRSGAVSGPRRGRSDFAWREGLAAECEERLWGDQGARGREYLQQQRGLTEEAIRAFGLGLLVISEEQQWITMPLCESDGTVVNVRFRRIPDANGEIPKGPKYRVCGGRELPLFGSQYLGNDLGEEVLITEGEFDVIALWQYGFKRSVVSGTGGAGTFRPEWLDDLEEYRGFVLLYDDDEKGDEGVEVAAEVLGAYRCSRGFLPRKDANECLVDGISYEEIEEAIADAESMVGVRVVGVQAFAAEIESLISNPQVLIGRDLGSDKLNEVLGGMRPGLWVFTGPSGHGKTTLTTWMCLEQARLDVPVALTSFEQAPIGTVQKLLRMQLGRSFVDVTVDARRQAIAELDALPLYILDHYGGMPLEQIVETIRYSMRRFGCKVFQIDHLHFLLDRTVEDERRAIDEIVRTLALLAVEEGITIILIAHPDKTHEREGRRVRLGDLKGSSAIQQDAHVGVVVQRAALTKKRNYPAARVYVDKARSEFACPGSNRLLAFDPDACVYADSWLDTPLGRYEAGGTSADQGGADKAAGEAHE